MTPFGIRTVPLKLLGAATLLAALAACRQDGEPRSANPAATSAVTYTRDVAPILFERCAPCHSPGGSAPFGLLDYESVQKRARLVVDAIQSRFMPPWLPEPGYGEFAGERRLTTAEIGTIARWVDEGTPRGSNADLPPAPALPAGWRLGEPDLVIRMPQPYTLPPDGADVWRNFVIPIPVAETRYVKTIEVHPGSARVVHHAVMAIDDMGSSRRLDAEDPDMGFAGMDLGEAHMPDGSLLGWTPGMLPFPGIEGAAWRLDPGTDAVLQLHMMPSGKPEPVQPAVGLYFSRNPGPGIPTYVLQLDADDQIDIPAGATAFEVSDTIELPVDVELHAVYPHAHYLGRSVSATATLPDGTMRWLLRIDRWDFKWQDVYRFAQPVALPRGTVLTMRWSYDNSAQNIRQFHRPPRRVVAGDQSSDEMAHLQLQMTLRTPQELQVLKEAHYGHLVEKNPRNARFLFGLAGALKDQGRTAQAAERYRAVLTLQPAHVPAHINLGAVLMVLGREDEAMKHFQAAVRLDPDAAGAHYNLAIAYGIRGQFDDAIRHYREALRRQPEFGEAHNNLGQVLSANGNMAEAILHLREAVRLLPGAADVHNNLGEALQRGGQLQEAVDHFRRALAIDPGHAAARQNRDAAAGSPGGSGRPRR
jgi:Tfp pilus assembly protein PilF